MVPWVPGQVERIQNELKIFVRPKDELSVRLFGIDTPELGQDPWGDRARQCISEILSSELRVSLQVSGVDFFGRAIAVD